MATNPNCMFQSRNRDLHQNSLFARCKLHSRRVFSVPLAKYRLGRILIDFSPLFPDDGLRCPCAASAAIIARIWATLLIGICPPTS